MADKPSLVDRIRNQRDRHRLRSRAFRIPVAVVGFALVVFGVALLVLPGPGWLVIAIGLALLALEFAWAERVLTHAVERLDAARERAAEASLAQKALGFGVGAAAAAAGLAALVLLDVPLLPF